MTILKTTLLTILAFIITTLLELFILSFDSNLALYPHVIGLSYLIPPLLTYIVFIIYFRRTNVDVSLNKISVVKNHLILVVLITSLAIGDRLFDLPFFHWKDLSNKYFGTKFTIEDTVHYNFSFLKLYYYISVLIIAPIFEELFFRYYIFGGLLKKYSFVTALLTSSLLFALIHVISPRNVIPAFVFGIVSALVYFKTQRIGYSILLHIITNVIWFGTVVFVKQYHQIMKTLNFGLLFWIVFLFGLFILIIGTREIKRQLASVLRQKHDYRSLN